MAKNFTDFQEITGTYTPPTVVDGVNQGIKNTHANKDMYLVGYDVDEPGGERRYTIDSVLLAASAHHVGLENVENKSLGQILDNTTLTGVTTADNMKILGDLVVEGDSVTMNTTIASTSAFGIQCFSPDSAVIGIEVQQFGPGAIARFLDGEDLAMDISSNGNVGVGIEASVDTSFTVLGDISANGQMFLTGAYNGRFVQQDGAKLDNIQPHADVTGLNLSTVEARLQELDSTGQFSDLVVGKGLDLLEDGETFNKTPALSAVSAPGVGDFSVQKLASVEYESDKTSDHSQDITFNLVPDGPYTGDVDTTFVKMTSAEHDRVNSVRGVVDPLYAADDGEDITSLHIANAYQDAYPDFWSTADETEYRDVIIPKVTESYNTVTSNSAWWQSTYMTTKANSGDWESTHTTMLSNSAWWQGTYMTTKTNSGKWESVYSTVYDLSGDWESTHTSVLDTSANWDSTHASVLATSSNWDSTHNTTLSNSAEWTASVNNTPDEFGDHVSLPAGEANLTKLNITESLTAQDDVKLGGAVYVLSAGEWKQGVTADVPLGDDTLHFVDGVLIHWDRGGYEDSTDDASDDSTTTDDASGDTFVTTAVEDEFLAATGLAVDASGNLTGEAWMEQAGMKVSRHDTTHYQALNLTNITPPPVPAAYSSSIDYAYNLDVDGNKSPWSVFEEPINPDDGPDITLDYNPSNISGVFMLSETCGVMFSSTPGTTSSYTSPVRVSVQPASAPRPAGSMFGPTSYELENGAPGWEESPALKNIIFDGDYLNIQDFIGTLEAAYNSQPDYATQKFTYMLVTFNNS